MELNSLPAITSTAKIKNGMGQGPQTLDALQTDSHGTFRCSSLANVCTHVHSKNKRQPGTPPTSKAIAMGILTLKMVAEAGLEPAFS